MANCKLSAIEFIQDTFAPTIAVSCSNDAAEVCAKNNLSFADMVEPFCKLSTEVEIRDAQGVLHNISNLRLILRDVNHSAPQPSMTKKLLSDTVTLSSRSYFNSTGLEFRPSHETPWFEAFRETFMNCCPNYDHEFIKNYLACIFVVSSATDNAIEQFNALTHSQQQNQYQSKQSKWFSTHILRYYVLLHDASSPHKAKAEKTIESMRSVYGNNLCYLLVINSRDPTDQNSAPVNYWNCSVTPKMPESPPDQRDSPVVSHPLESRGDSPEHEITIPSSVSITSLRSLNVAETKDENYGSFLSTEDYDRIKAFIHEFSSKSLIVWVEKSILTLSEQVASKKRGFWKIFGSQNRPVSTSSNSGESNAANVVYTAEAPEMQVRRLADLAFAFHMYELASNMYHTAKRNFNSDHAWLYYAGAIEMGELAAFMLGKNPSSNIETAINTYAYTCRQPLLATRSTLLLTEVLKYKKMYTEAASQFIKMTSEDHDLNSALLLEQAAHCYLNHYGVSCHNQTRKYAFHMILSGHRFSKAGQRMHALRAYCQTLLIYKGKQWNLAEDHINFTIGRQCSNLKYLDKSCDAFEQLIAHSKQNPAQQAAYFREYLSVLSSATKDSPTPSLTIPEIDWSRIQLYLPSSTGQISKLDSVHHTFKYQKEFESLERLFGIPSNKTSIFCYSTMSKNNKVPITAFVEEDLAFELTFKKRLKLHLVMANIVLLWEFEGKSDEDAVKIDSIPKFTMLLQENEKTLILKIKPRKIGKLKITGITYDLSCATTNQQQPDVVRGMQPVNLESNQRDIFEVMIMDDLPRVDLTMTDLPENLYCGQIVSLELNIKNVGTKPVHAVKLASTSAHLLVVPDSELLENNTLFLHNKIEPGEEVTRKAFVRASDQIGECTLNLLFVFIGEDDKFRTLRKNLIFNTVPALTLSANIIESDKKEIPQVIQFCIENGANEVVQLKEIRCVQNYTIQAKGSDKDIKDVSLRKGENEMIYLTLNSDNDEKKIDTDSFHWFKRSDEKDISQDVVMLSAFWEIDKTIVGQNNVSIELKPFIPPNQQSFINVQFIYSQKISYEFNSKPRRLCHVPVILRLSNNYESDVEVIVDACQNNTELIKDYKTDSQRRFIWSKQVYFCENIKSGEYIDCNLVATFSCTGLYDLSRVKITVKSSNEKNFQSQKITTPYLISVGDVSLLE